MPSHTPPCHEPFANAQPATASSASTAVLLVEGGVAALPLGLISSTRRMLDHGVARQRWRPHATRIADRALSSRASLSQSQRSTTLRQRGREVPESKIQVCRMRLQNAECRSGRSSQFCNGESPWVTMEQYYNL